MKAYETWDQKSNLGYETVVFANNAQEARKIAFHTVLFDYAEWIDVRVKRLPEADKLYRPGKSEIDWSDDEDRLVLVRDCGWTCVEFPFMDCDKCIAKEYCQ